MRVATLAVGLVLALAGPSFAQNPSPGTNAPTKGQATQNTQNIQQQVRNNLQAAGFSDIKIMPESFMVRAKDKSGNPVMMVINPDSITAVTEEVNHSNAAGSTTGAAPNRGSAANPNGTNPNGAARGQNGAH